MLITGIRNLGVVNAFMTPKYQVQGWLLRGIGDGLMNIGHHSYSLPTMSKHLLDLPNELLTQILSYLDHSRTTPDCWKLEEFTNSRLDLFALTLVNHRLSTIGCRSLYEDILLYLKDSSERPLDDLRFAQCCTDNPAVPRRVRRLRIQGRFCGP